LDSAKYYTENLGLLTALNFTVCSALYLTLSYLNYDEIITRFDTNSQYSNCGFDGYTLINNFNFAATTGLYSNIAAMIIETMILLQISLTVEDLKNFEYRRRWWGWLKYYFILMTLLYMSGFTNQVIALGWYVSMTLPNYKIDTEGCSFIEGNASRSFDYKDPWGFHNMLSIVFTLFPTASFILCWSYSIIPVKKSNQILPDSSVNSTGDLIQDNLKDENDGNDSDDDSDEELHRGNSNLMSRRPMRAF